MAHVQIQVGAEQFEVDFQPFDDLPKLRDKLHMLHNVKLDGYTLYYDDHGHQAKIPETVPFSTLGIANRAVLTAKRNTAVPPPAINTQKPARPESVPNLDSAKYAGALFFSGLAPVASGSSSPGSAAATSGGGSGSDPFLQLEETLTHISTPRSATTPGGRRPSLPQRSPSGSSITQYQQHQQQQQQAAAQMRVRHSVPDASQPFLGSPQRVPHAVDTTYATMQAGMQSPYYAAQQQQQPLPPLHYARSPNPATFANAPHSPSQPPLLRAASSPNPFAALEAAAGTAAAAAAAGLSPRPHLAHAKSLWPERSPTSANGLLSPGYHPLQATYTPRSNSLSNGPTSSLQASPIKATTTTTTATNPFASFGESHPASAQAPVQAQTNLVSPITGNIFDQLSPQPPVVVQLAPAANTATEYHGLSSSSPAASSPSSYSSSASSSASHLSVHTRGPSGLGPDQSVIQTESLSATTPGTASQRPSLTSTNPFALVEAAAAAASSAGVAPALPSSRRPSGVLSPSSTVYESPALEAPLPAMSPRLTLLMIGVQEESAEVARDQDEELLLRQYTLEAVQVRASAIRSERARLAAIHADRLAEKDVALKAAQELVAAEERASAAFAIECETIRTAHDRKLTSLESSAASYAVERLARKTELDAWLATDFRALSGQLAVAREKHAADGQEDRRKAVERVCAVLEESALYEDILAAMQKRKADKQQLANSKTSAS